MVLLWLLCCLLVTGSSLRLPTDVIPSHQLLKLDVDMKEWSYKGYTEIKVAVKKARDNIWLYSAKCKIAGVLIQSADGASIKIKTATLDKKKKILYMSFPKNIEKGNYVIKISFSNKILDHLQGVYRTGYIDREGVKHYQVSTHFEPDKAREGFPCFDEPSFRIRIKVFVTHPVNYKCNSAGKVHSITKAGPRATTEFRETERISVYLLAINVHDMESVSCATKRGIPVTMLAPKHLLEPASETAAMAAASIDYFEGYLGVNYPFHKMDMIGIFDFNAGGMENVAMIHLMYDCAYGTFDDRSITANLYCRTVVVHEVSHMWFGDMVSLKWWDDLWLKEGFARFITAHAMDEGEIIKDRPKGAHMVKLVDRGFVSGRDADKYKFTKPIRQKLLDSYGAAAMFNSLSYSKSAWILRGIQRIIGKPAFQAGLQKYFKTYKMQSADFNDFMNCFGNMSKGLTVKKFSEQWLNQPGLPVVIMKYKEGKVLLNQSRYTQSWDYNTNQTWPIPLNYRTNKLKETKYQIWDSKTLNVTLSAPFEWVIIDTDKAAFSEVLYTESNYLALAKQLLEDHTVLSELQRKVLVASVGEHYKTGKVSLTAMLQLSRYITKEKRGGITKFWVSMLLGVKRQLVLAENQHRFRNYLKALMMPHIKQVMKNEIGDDITWNVRTYYRLCFYLGIRWRYRPAITRARALIKDFKTGRHINQNFLSLVLNFFISIKNGWQWIYNKSRTYPRSASEYNLFIYSLAKTRDVNRQKFLLHMSITSNRGPRSGIKNVVCYIARNNPQLAWNFFKKNFQFYFNMLGESQFSFSALIECAIENLSTQAEYDDVVKFFKTHPTGTGTQGMKRGLNDIKKNIAAQQGEGKTEEKKDSDKFDKTVEKFCLSLPE